MDERGLLPMLEAVLRTERDGFEFHTMTAETSEDPGAEEAFVHLADEEIRGFFRELAEWEDGHYQLLLHEDEALGDVYWSELRFNPLVQKPRDTPLKRVLRA